MSNMKHIIANISFPSKRAPDKPDYLLCICGWEGVALDLKPYFLHKKTAPPVEEGLAIDIAKGVFNTRLSSKH